MLARLLQNHVLANLAFALVLILGALSFAFMPREQDPTINFNWIDITTPVPGAAAEDIERRVTDVLEDAARRIADVRFVSSVSREGLSNLLIRFEEIDERTFDKRVADLRREIQAVEEQLPAEALDPVIFEVTTANAFPTATLAVVGVAEDENLRYQARRLKDAVERIKGVDRVLTTALRDPELQIRFDPSELAALGLPPTALSDAIGLWYRDISAGRTEAGGENWLVRLAGTTGLPSEIADLPLPGLANELKLGDVAEVVQARKRATQAVRLDGRPAVMLAINKQPKANTLQLVERVNAFVERENALAASTGVKLVLVDDQTLITRDALSIMQNNLAIGLGMVMLVTWLFLGTRIALLTSIGIPFILAGTFWLLASVGQTLNVSVLLGVVISLGMLVDDAVVVAEAIYYRLLRGAEPLAASIAALREVAQPVTTAVLTTMATFLPLMLLPGILGQFMFVIPLVVTSALAISLVEAYWMLPAHVVAAKVRFDHRRRQGLRAAVQRSREKIIHRIRTGYTRALIRALHHPWLMLCTMLLAFSLAIAVVFAEQIAKQLPPEQAEAVASLGVKIDFFASDPIRLFYVNLEMPVGTPLEETLARVQSVEQRLRSGVREGEVRQMISYAGVMFTETAPVFGEQYGQVMVALNPRADGLREVDEMIDTLRPLALVEPGPTRIFFLRLAGGPPATKPVSVKVRGDDWAEIERAASSIKSILGELPGVRDITDDAGSGQRNLVLRIDHDAVRRAGVDPMVLTRSLRLLVDGEVVAATRERGEELELRVIADQSAQMADIDELLRQTLPGANGQPVALSQLLHAERNRGRASIRHFNFRRAVTVEADIDKEVTNAIAVNDQLKAKWAEVRGEHAGIDLDFSGLLDDIQESIDAMKVLFTLGVGLVYLILGTQFRSYFQPLMILLTIPMAFTGVVLGLMVTSNPLSLFTMYGVVALAGIAVNSAIVLISAANARLAAGMSVLHATLYAARRRVVPILITSLTTIAGLFSLATGLGGKSLLWGPVATSIVWGLAFSTLLTLFVIPVFYTVFMRLGRRWRAFAGGTAKA